MRTMILTIILSVSFFISCSTQSFDFKSHWKQQINRTWVGAEFWANRLHDWKVSDGRLECINSSFPLRTIHLLTRRIGDATTRVSIEVETGILSASDKTKIKSGAGIFIGAGGDLDYRSAALAQQRAVPGMGLMAGIDENGHLFLINLNDGPKAEPRLSEQSLGNEGAKISLNFEQKAEGDYQLVLTGQSLGSEKSKTSIELSAVDQKLVTGNLGLISNGVHSWFKNLRVSGSSLEEDNTRSIGPILGSQYTLSEGIIKLTAQFFPMAEKDPKRVTLEVKKTGRWQKAAETDIVIPGYTAPFRLENWEGTDDVPYRVAYEYNPGGGTETAYWQGVFRKDPLEKEEILIAGFTGNHNISHPFFDPEHWGWDKNHIWFPHLDVTADLNIQNPDVLFFSGDQVYEGASPTFADRKNIFLDYLYKWYLWMWAYRDLTKDRPSISIPDDHDVYQGNLWGAGGGKTDKDDKGGYVHPADFIKMVERTQTSHLPDPYDPNPIKQGIGTYYTDMTYAGIGFAILEDRKFKSGCRGLFPELAVAGRPDHIVDPNYKRERVNLPGLKLLGDKQIEFLNKWSQNWHHQYMKIALSQTVFANMATHHGKNGVYLLADLDSNGWPQSGRNRALRALRKGFSFMLSGDQHLSTIVHHGIDDWNDAGYSMCVPSIANFYPRGWIPRIPGNNRDDWMPENLGEHVDGFGNKVTVYATTNPPKLTGDPVKHEPVLLHEGMPGYGLIRMNKMERTITIECWPRYADVSKDPNGPQYTGWPKVIKQEDNYGRKASAFLPLIDFGQIMNPVVQVIDESTNEIVYTLRVSGKSFRPKVFHKDGGAYPNQPFT